MPDPLSTSRFGLPLLAAGQAQKEVTHNEALVLVDALIAPRVVAVNAAVPPTTASAGRCWAVGAAPTGAWAGQALALAIATANNGWRFVAMPVGAGVTVDPAGAVWRRGQAEWLAPPLVTLPTGGTVVDSECRAAIASLVGALVQSGIVRTP